MSVVKAVFCFALLFIWAVFPVMCIAQGSSSGAVAGVVLAPDGSPVAGATIALSAPDVPAHIVTSTDDGRFLLRDVASGSYTIKTTVASFAPKKTPANIDLDLRVLKMIPIASGHLDVVAESFNLLNHSNVSLLNTAFGLGLTPHSGFDQPIAASTARKIQFSLDYEF